VLLEVIDRIFGKPFFKYIKRLQDEKKREKRKNVAKT